jgi:hypothetical protein
MAIDASMLATTIRIHAGLESDIRTVVVIDNCTGVILEKVSGGLL